MRAEWFLMLALVACSRPAPPPPEAPPWTPGVVYRAKGAVNARGLLDRRGLVHAHSHFSHDACDGKPRNDAGIYDEDCLGDFRRGLCLSMHDFAFLTDHTDSFAEAEFPQALLYRPALGDALVEHGSGPTANWLACPEAPPALVMAGAETSPMMPVGLERHVGPPGSRASVYGDSGAAALLQVKDAGAIALVAHTEAWTPEQLVSMPLDGFEMYNLHANTVKNAGVVVDVLLGKVDQGDLEGMPHPDAFLLYFNAEDPTYLETWGTVFARGAHRVTTMGTDCHRNSFPQPLKDGERVDSYRRMMLGFSNHLLVKPKADGSWDDRDLKEALRAGRLYGAFEFLGYPVGFDYLAQEGQELREMGQTVSIAKGVRLQVSRPQLQQLSKEVEAPELTMRLLKAREGGWDEVAKGSEDRLEFQVQQPGAYRAEVRMVARHLKGFAGKRIDLVKADRPWVYSNVIYVEP